VLQLSARRQRRPSVSRLGGWHEAVHFCEFPLSYKLLGSSQRDGADCSGDEQHGRDERAGESNGAAAEAGGEEHCEILSCSGPCRQSAERKHTGRDRAKLNHPMFSIEP
jgi:hypothetical protein